MAWTRANDDVTSSVSADCVQLIFPTNALTSHPPLVQNRLLYAVFLLIKTYSFTNVINFMFMHF